MESKTKRILSGSLLAGSIIGLSAMQANANELVRAENLGSGAQVRATLLSSERALDHAIELKCGEKEETKKEAKSEKSESKAEEHKCGEGKCGEKSKEEGKKAEKSESKAEEHKCGEGKCGEGKCGM